MTPAPGLSIVTVADDPATAQACADSVRRATHRARAGCPHIIVTQHDAPAAFAQMSSGAAASVMVLPAHHRLRPHALQQLIAAAAAAPTGVYADLVEVGADGVPCAVRAQPAWAPEWWRSGDPADGLVVVRREFLSAALVDGPLTAGAEGYDLGLRAIERREALHHLVATVADIHGSMPQEPRVRALRRHLQRCELDADVEVAVDPANAALIVRRRRGSTVPVSVVIPTRGSVGSVWGRERVYVLDSVRSIAERSTHEATEVVVVADAATPGEVREQLLALRDVQVRIVDWNAPFNFSAKINAGCAAADGELLLLLNDDTELRAPGSISEMAALFTDGDADDGRPVGMVGAQLLHDDGTLQHAGHVYHEHVLHAFPGWAPGSHPHLRHPRECSGVTAAAAMVDRGTFTAAGGFPEQYPLDFNDVHFSLSVRASGRRVLWTPLAEWYHFEGRSRPRGPRLDEFDALTGRWATEVCHDPYYHSGLEVRRADWMPVPGWARPGWPPRREPVVDLRDDSPGTVPHRVRLHE